MMESVNLSLKLLKVLIINCNDCTPGHNVDVESSRLHNSPEFILATIYPVFRGSLLSAGRL